MSEFTKSIKAKELVKLLIDELTENGEDFNIKVYDNYMGEYRNFKIDAMNFYENMEITLNSENC